MYAIAFAIFRVSDDASDAVQEAMSRLWSQHLSLTLPDSPDAFCATVVRRTCLDMIRRRRFDPLEGIEAADTASTDSDAAYHTALNYIKALLVQFPEKQRKVLTLSFISQLSNDEITTVTGLSDANVRQIISRGRQKLKTILSHEAK